MKYQKLKFLLAVSAAIIGTLSIIVQAQATSCWRPTPAEHIKQTDIIFFGFAMKGAKGPRDEKQRVVKFKVIRAYKGVRGNSVSIAYINDHGALNGWGFRYRQATLVFASIDKNEVIRVGYCTMIPYHARQNLHSKYWDILAKMKP